ncbi:unnamed protein product, partial [Symbiodinium necroappetens]
VLCQGVRRKQHTSRLALQHLLAGTGHCPASSRPPLRHDWPATRACTVTLWRGDRRFCA